MYKSQLPSLWQLNAHSFTGYEITRRFIIICLIELYSSFSLNKETDPEQFSTIADDIIEDYGFLRLDGFKLFCKQARKGRYGQTYGRLDEATLFQWLEKFVQEFWTYLEDERIKEHNANTATRGVFSEQKVELPESTQRIRNRLAGFGNLTDAEREAKKDIAAKRKQIIKDNRHLLATPEGIKELNNLLKSNEV